MALSNTTNSTTLDFIPFLTKLANSEAVIDIKMQTPDKLMQRGVNKGRGEGVLNRQQTEKGRKKREALHHSHPVTMET